jgi:hypothetical protein
MKRATPTSTSAPIDLSFLDTWVERYCAQHAVPRGQRPELRALMGSLANWAMEGLVAAAPAQKPSIVQAWLQSLHQVLLKTPEAHSWKQEVLRASPLRRSSC